jgi:hypothetical protein
MCIRALSPAIELALDDTKGDMRSPSERKVCLKTLRQSVMRLIPTACGRE